MRARVDLQHIFHRRHEGGIGLWRDDPLPFQMRLERVFFNARPTVLKCTDSTISSSTTFSARSRNVHLQRPFGGLEQAKAVSLACFSPSKTGLTGGVSRRDAAVRALNATAYRHAFFVYL